VLLLCLLPGAVQAVIPMPPPTNSPTMLDSWSFTDTNTWTSDYGFAPLSFTNLSASILGNGTALVLDSTNAAWLRYNVTETNGSNNLTVNQGTVMFWFAPNWSGTNQGGIGPGQWGRLIEAGYYTTNASYGWWSLYLDADGANLYFSAQTNNGTGATFLSAPIAWTTNRWHFIALTYCSTNTALYLDGALAANGSGLTCWPGPDVLANGFGIGSDSNGVAQAHGMFDDLTTYNYVVDADTIGMTYSMYSIVYYLNPMNFANLSSAPSSPSYLPTFNAITGPGFLQPVSTNTANCVTSSNIWLTNVVATLTTNGTTVTFTIAGGTNGLFYDVFAAAAIWPAGNTNAQWAWMGQGNPCVTYSIPGLTNSVVFLRLGTPQDSDLDGLTDAYERLVSKTDQNKADTSGDGMLDGWKVLWGLNPLINNAAQPSERSNYGYNLTDWLNTITGIRAETIGLDAEGNVQTSQ
jgi:hypothetical protein